jgi:hypothetical protein
MTRQFTGRDRHPRVSRQAVPGEGSRCCGRRLRADSAGAPSMGAILEVQVLPRADHSERSETQLREGDRAWEGSVNRNREPMDKNCI